MRRSPRLVAPFVFLVLSFTVGSCAHLGNVELRDLLDDGNNDLHSATGQKIDGYTKTDDVYYQYHGYVRLDGPDSLRFSPVKFEREGETEDPPPPGQDRFTLGVTEVKSFNLD